MEVTAVAVAPAVSKATVTEIVVPPNSNLVLRGKVSNRKKRDLSGSLFFAAFLSKNREFVKMAEHKEVSEKGRTCRMEEVTFVLELIGVAAFSVSGAMLALEKKADIFGVIFLAITTALGGGVIRDLLIGQIPPKMFVSYYYLLIAVLAALAVFVDAYVRRESYKKNKEKLDAVNNVFDAIGLAVFTITGMNAAMQVGGNALLTLSVGVCTGVGGGMLRDVMVNTMPKVLRKRVYAVASLLGGGLYYVMLRLGAPQLVSVILGMLLIFALRLCATIYKWNLPTVDLE